MSDIQVNYRPIGFMRCDAKYRYEVPRQGVFARNRGRIELNRGENFEQALRDLDGFDRIWVLFVFHLNNSWKPLVNPPYAPDNRKVSLFATRSPHRPNSIGLSCVELLNIQGRMLDICNFDLLDGTPILDIKPYIPQADAFPTAATGWLPPLPSECYRIIYSDLAEKQLVFITKRTSFDIKNFIELQLSDKPFDGRRKRLECLSHEHSHYQLAFRTWRIHFHQSNPMELYIDSISSAYNMDELASDADDRYRDKTVHREFRQHFAQLETGESQVSD